MENHVPVLLSEVIGIFGECVAGGEPLIVDATLGGGGHSDGLLGKFQNLMVVGFDRDGTAREIAGEKLSKYGERVRIMPGNFSEMADLARDIQ
ncbi:MAG: 16S rRNA (cytosine(1402)-N(4))-methyltransferase, partial [Synergistaceae bacterium]|nr:16S rRNA (cytosine(1402)-N(4))-methyltransferase [Synergistaceae bacterium]